MALVCAVSFHKGFKALNVESRVQDELASTILKYFEDANSRPQW
jgi:hypothetical protein